MPAAPRRCTDGRRCSPAVMIPCSSGRCADPAASSRRSATAAWTGSARLAAGKAIAAGLHVYEPEAEGWNRGHLERAMPGMPVVLVEWAWRIQGLVVPPGNPKGISRLGDLEGLTLMPRQERSGSHLLLDHLMRQAGLESARVRFLAPPARSEADVALAIAEGKADAGFAIETVARQFRLDFVPLFRERYDLAVWRRDYFEPPLQKLLAFCRTSAFQKRAEELGGYDVSGLGQVHKGRGHASALRATSRSMSRPSCTGRSS